MLNKRMYVCMYARLYMYVDNIQECYDIIKVCAAHHKFFNLFRNYTIASAEPNTTNIIHPMRLMPAAALNTIGQL